jgi:hypothetical protein
MPNDPLALPGTVVPQEPGYDEVFAAVTATERGRWFLSEYASRNRQADTDLVVSAIARIEAAVAGDALEREWTRVPDISAAAERIADIAFGLRERAVDGALCDALDAAVREICEACAGGPADPGLRPDPSPSNENVAIVPIETASAAHQPEAEADERNGEILSGASAFELQDNEKFAAAAAALAASMNSLSEQPEPPEQPQSDTAGEVQGNTLDAVIAESGYESAAKSPEPPEPQTTARKDSDSRWLIGSPDFFFDSPAEPQIAVEPEAPEQSGQPHALLSGPHLLPGPQDDPAELFEPTPSREGTPPPAVREPPAEMPASAAMRTPVVSALIAPPAVEAISAPDEPVPPVQIPMPQLRVANGPTVHPMPRPAPANPLAAVHALSEDELIALFG